MTTAIPASPPITSGARCLYAAHLVAGLGFLAFASFAVGDSEGRLLLPAALSALVAWLLRARLDASGLLDVCAAEDDAPTDRPFSNVEQPGSECAAPPRGLDGESLNRRAGTA